MKNVFIIFLLILLAQENLLAQDRFTVNSLIGCAPFEVEVTEDTDVTGSTLTQYDYGDGKGWTTETRYEYQSPGQYTLQQLINNDQIPGGNKLSSKTITVEKGAVVPKFSYSLCSNRKVSIIVSDETGDEDLPAYPAYSLNFGDGSPSIIVDANVEYSHTYADVAPKAIAVVGIVNKDVSVGHAANNDCGVARVTVYPLDDLPNPLLDQVNVITQDRSDILGQDQIELKYRIADNVKYQIRMSVNNLNFTEIGAPSPSGTFVVDGLDTQNNVYCFQLAMKDPCDPANPDILSNSICSTTTSVKAENNQNIISWKAETSGLLNMEIYRDNTLLTTVNAGQSPFTDTDVLCNVNYCYQIRANYNQGFSTNETICVTGRTENAPPALENVTASVFGKDIYLEWPLPDLSVKEYRIERSLEDGTYEMLGTSESPLFQDQDADITTSFHCYKISYEDECGNVAPLSTDVCPVLLTVTQGEGLDFALTWTSYTGWKDGVSEYRIEKIDDEENIFETIIMPAGTNSYIDNNSSDNRQIINYRIAAIPVDDGNGISYSNIVRMEQKVKVFFPTAFTPNGDQLNDVFIAKGTFIQDLTLKIFNRWGELLFVSEDRTIGWDGNYRGQPVQEGSYVYSAEVTDYNNKTISLSGTFRLIRNRKN